MSSSKSNKNAEKSNVALAPVGEPLTAPVHRAPAVPADRPPPIIGRGRAPISTEMARAPGAAKEVRASARYIQVVGPYAPPAEEMATAIETAHAWYTEANAAANWASYASDQSVRAYEVLQNKLSVIATPLTYAAERDVTVPEEFNDLSGLVLARSDAGKRAAVNRKARERKATPSPKRGGKKAAPPVVTQPPAE